MSRMSAEGATCEVCRRRLLAGEEFALFDDAQRNSFPVCALCHQRAAQRGWTRTPQPTRPDIP